MKRIRCFGALLSCVVALLVPDQADALRDIDYDFMLVNVDTLLKEFAPTFDYPLAGVDNDGNGIRDEDSLAMLSSILRGTSRVASLDSAMVSSIQSDFASNRSAADNDLKAEGSVCSLLDIAGYPCKLTEIIQMPGLLPPGVGADLTRLLLDFFGGLVTIADTPQTFNFINGYIDALANAFADELPPEIPGGVVEDLKNQLHLQSGNYNRWGANGNRPNRLGANGNVDEDGATNYTEYQAAGTNREAWLSNCTIVPPIHITGHPQGGQFYTGDEITLNVTFVGGESPFAFQWQRAEDFPEALITLPGETNQTLYIPYATATYDGWKPWVRVSDPVTVWNAGGTPGAVEPTGWGGRTSVFADVDVNYRSWGVRYQPAAGYKFTGDDWTTTFVVWGGTNVPTYQWYREGVGAISGQTTRTLAMTNLQPSDEARYYCEATNLEGTLTSSLVSLYVRNHIQITGQPTGGNYASGQSHTFSVTTVDGHPDLTYYWYRANIGSPPGQGGTLVASGTTTGDPPAMPIEYEIAALSGGQQGQYYCGINDMAGEIVVSDTVVLRVLSIQSHPLPQDVRPGFPALFEVTVLPGSGYPGTAPDPEYTYQWKQDGVDIPGATASVYVIAAATIGQDEGDYTCVVADSAPDHGPYPPGDAGPVTLESAAAPLTISADPIEFLVQPVGARKYTGESHTFYTFVTGGQGNPFEYQWYKDDVELFGETNFFFTIDSLAVEDTGLYWCEVGELTVRPPAPYAYTAIAILEVADPLSILSNPEDVDLYVGETFNATFGLAGGLGVQRFQWFKGAQAIPDATDAVYEIPSVTHDDAGKYRCDVMDDRGIALSTTFAWLNVFEPLAIVADPVGGVGTLGGAHLFAVEAAGGIGTLHYEWLKDGEVVGDDRPVLPLSSLVEDDDGTYKCSVTDAQATTLESAEAVLIVEADFAIPPTGQPVPYQIYVNESYTFYVNTVGADGIVSYQWYFDPDGAKVAEPIPGANLSALVVADAETDDTGLYSIEVTDDMGTPGDTGDDVTLMSDPALLEVVEHMAFAAQPVSQEIELGHPATFFVTVSGGMGVKTYQWQKDGADMPNRTNETLTISPVQEDDLATYLCVACDDHEEIVSEEATLGEAPGTPAAGFVGLSMLAGLCAIAGAAWIRRRK